MKHWNIYLCYVEKGGINRFICTIEAPRKPVGRLRELERKMGKDYPGEWELVAHDVENDPWRHRYAH